MRVPDIQTTSSVGVIDEEFRMQIDQSSLVHLMSVLTNLYSDPMTAVIREYSTNALDSHTEAGNSNPIEITLPSTLNPNFVVQDQGIGLSVNDLRDVYSMYGKSTRRGSDEAVGMLGLGCKSGLTYALSFSVEAVKDGVKTIASVTKDIDGVGCIKVLDTASTHEPNGVTISIPVRSQDVEQFRTKAQEFFKYWRKGTVLVNGEEPEFPEALWLDEDVAVIHTPDRSSNYGNYTGNSRIVMGGVAYPFNPDFKYTVVAWVPIGEVNFTPSREALHDTTRTKDTVKMVQEFVKMRFDSALKEMVEAAESPYEALKIAARWQWTTKKSRWLKNLGAVIEPPRSAFNLGSGRYRTIKSAIPAVNVVSDRHIIVNFPFQAVSPKHRHRLESLGINDCLILPTNTDFSVLEGREKVIEWDYIVENTPDPPKIKRGPVVKTVHTWRWGHHSHLRSTTTDPMDATKPIVYYGMREWPRFDNYPDAQFVQLYANQNKKFVRENPSAVEYNAYRIQEESRVVNSLTSDDRIFLHQEQVRYAALKNVTEKLDDKELVRIVKVCTGSQPARVARVNVLYQQHKVPYHPVHATLLKRYPLLAMMPNTVSSGALNDLVLYLNTKFQQEGESQ